MSIEHPSTFGRPFGMWLEFAFCWLSCNNAKATLTNAKKREYENAVIRIEYVERTGN